MVPSRDASEHASKNRQEKGAAVLFNATAPFFMECGVRHRVPGLRIKTENKGFAGSQAQTLPELQRGKPKSPTRGLRIKTENKGFVMCYPSIGQ